MTVKKEEDFVKNQLLGEILVSQNMIDREQLKEALRLQENEKKYVGELLIKLGYIVERDVMVALVEQCKLPYIAIDKYNVDKEIANLIPKETALKYHAIPLGRVGNILSVVMADPLDSLRKEEFKRITNCEIASFIATKQEIDSAIRKCYTEGE